MALAISSTLTVNVANTELTFIDTTGVYNASTNTGGYGTPNRAVANNIVTEHVFTYPDLTTATITTDNTTLPTTDWVPKNALSRIFDLTDLSLTEFTQGVVQVNYRPFFTTASAGTVNVTNGLTTVTRNSAQDFTVDFADSSLIRIDGVNYTIASKVAATITLTTAYAGTTATGVTAYIGYQTTAAALIIRPFLDCFQPQWAVLDVKSGCLTDREKSLLNLYCMYLSVLAKIAETDYTGANNLMIDLVDLCDCVETGGGCC